MGTLEAVELGHASEVTLLGHPDICYHEITNPNINLVHFSLQPKNLKCTSLAIQYCAVPYIDNKHNKVNAGITFTGNHLSLTMVLN